MLEWWERLLFLGTTIGSGGALGYLYWCLPGVWRGEREPPAAPGPITVYRRSYPTYVLLGTAGCGGIALILLAVLIDHMALFTVGTPLLSATVPLGVLHWSVNAFNRPRFLVPPSCREQRGEWAERRLRRQRKRAGLPPTEHLVKLYEVPPDDHDGGPTWLCAICEDEECGWLEFADHEEADEERALREKAAEHTSRTPPPVVPWPPTGLPDPRAASGGARRWGRALRRRSR